jgi:catechol 2,3-dioxygenase-like lactoylglutathione lyase family enzyme
MRVLRLAWLGVPTNEYDATLRLFRDVLGMPVEFEEATTVELSTESDDRVQLFAPGDPHHERFDAAVALFEVDDAAAARAELDEAGVELVGEPESDSRWTWFHFRTPDGNLYSLGSRR